MLHQALGHQVDATVVGRINRLECVVLGPVPGLDRRERVRARARFDRDCRRRPAWRRGSTRRRAAAAESARASDCRGRARHRARRDRSRAGRSARAAISRWIALIDQPRGDESGREPVEQLGMARRFAAEPEVGRRRDDSPAEVVLPDPVDHHAGRQRIVGSRQPVRQLEPAARVRRNRGWRLTVEERETRHAARNDLAGTGGIAAPLKRRRRPASPR